MRTNDVVRFSPIGTAVLTLASLISAAGFLWPFFYNGQSLPRTQLFFWAALTVAFFCNALPIQQITRLLWNIANVFAPLLTV